MARDTRILVIDDDPNINRLIALYLQKENFSVISAYRGDDGLEMVKKEAPDLVLLDIMLPGMDGWQVCRAVRQISSIPIIMLTAKGETFDKVLGLELGADDYIVKPFDPKELVARVKAVVRRTAAQPDQGGGKELVFPGLTVSLSTYSVLRDGAPVELAPKELELLFYLASHKGQVFTREQLLEQVWGFDYFGDSRTVDVHIKRIREKLWDENASWQIKTVWGVGYKFEPKV